jgi:hypothetical protein
MTENPAELLGELSTLRGKTRRDRRSYAVPLLVFAALILIAPALYWSHTPEIPSDLPPGGIYEMQVTSGPFTAFESPLVAFGGNNLLIQWYWMAGLITCFAVTGWWYRRRAARIGIETDIRGYLLAGGAGIVGVVFGVQILEALGVQRSTLYSNAEIQLVVLIVAAVASPAVLLAGVRWRRARTFTVYMGTLLAVVAFTAAGMYMVNGLTGLFVIAGALLALAWSERSALLAGIGVVFAGVSVYSNMSGPANFFDFGETRLDTLANMALPAAVLIVGALMARLVAR